MSLRSLSNDAILSRIRRLTRCERSLTLRVLLCLSEIERRRLHYQLGYRSMFHFCTEALGYSEPTAGRRIQTARAIALYPEIQDLFTAGRVNVCTIAKVAGILTPENKDSILERIRGRTLHEVDAIVAEYRPCEKPRERVKVIAVPAAAPAAVEAVTAAAASLIPTPSAPAQAQEFIASGACDTRMPEPDARGQAPAGSPAFEPCFVLQFPAGKAFMARLEEIRSLAGHRIPPHASLETLFGFLMDYMIARESPAARTARREHRAQRASAANIGSNPRHISARLRDEVFLRDGRRCTYVSPDGRRCESTRLLQVDHIVPVARGGTAQPDNLRLLCAQHNRLEAEKLGLPGGPTRGANTATAHAGAGRAHSH